MVRAFAHDTWRPSHKRARKGGDMPHRTVLELPEHEIDDEDWEDDEELGTDEEELDLDEYDDDLDEEDAAGEL
jgi:hypothetical protein